MVHTGQDRKYLLFALASLTKAKVWEWYGKTWAIYGPYLEMVWEGWVMIWNSYGAKCYQILRYGKCMGRTGHRVLKRLRHVAMALKNSVPNKLAFRSKWPRCLLHHCFLSSQMKRNRLKREKITFTLIMWKHLIISQEFYEEKSLQVWKRRFIKSQWVN